MRQQGAPGACPASAGRAAVESLLRKRVRVAADVLAEEPPGVGVAAQRVVERLERAAGSVLRAVHPPVEELVAAALELVRVGEGEQLRGAGQCVGLRVGADVAEGVDEGGVGGLAGEVGFEEVAEAAVVDDALGGVDEQDGPHGRREFGGVADAADLAQGVVDRAVEGGVGLWHRGLVYRRRCQRRDGRDSRTGGCAGLDVRRGGRWGA